MLSSEFMSTSPHAHLDDIAARRNRLSDRMTDFYQNKVLVDDLAGERAPPHIPEDMIILASDLPRSVRIVRVDEAAFDDANALLGAPKSEALVLAIDPSTSLIKMATLLSSN